MSDDLVKRLRDDAEFAANRFGLAVDKWIMSEAADRIEAQAAAINAALAELDASPIMNAHICKAKRLLRGAREAMK